jgi:Ca2+-binding EF-hand superfamily protein
VLLQREIEFHSELRALAIDLKQRHDWTLNRAFASVDTGHEGFITYSSLVDFLRSNGYNPSENEVVAIIRRLDSDADQRVGYDEFRTMFDD